MWGHYYDVWENGSADDMLKGAILDLYDMAKDKDEIFTYDRIKEIAEKTIGYIKDNLCEDDIKDYLEDAELSEKEAEYFGVKNILYPRNFKIVEVELKREQKLTLTVAVPEEDEYYDIEDYILEYDYLDADDEGDWCVDETSELCCTKSLDDVLTEYDSDDLYNYEAIRNGEYN